MIENRYNCPTALWRKFNKTQRAFYNDLFVVFRDRGILPTKLDITDDQLEILAHNHACEAAWNLKYFTVAYKP